MKTVLSNYIMNRVSAKAERLTKYWVAYMTQDCRVKSPDTLCYEVQRYFCKLTVPRRKYWKCFSFRNCQSTSSQGWIIGIIPLHLLIAAQLIFVGVQVRVNIRGQSEIKKSRESQEEGQEGCKHEADFLRTRKQWTWADEERLASQTQ